MRIEFEGVNLDGLDGQQLTRLFGVDDDGELSWMLDALCTQMPPESFFTDGKGRNNGQHYVEARQICRACPVSSDCLDWALSIERHELYSWGVYGGLSANQRRKLLRREFGNPCTICGTSTRNMTLHRRRAHGAQAA